MKLRRRRASEVVSALVKSVLFLLPCCELNQSYFISFEGKLPEETLDAFGNDRNKKFFNAPLIYQHLRLLKIEEKRRSLPNYMENVQKDVTIGMREVLVDWLVEVAEEYKLVSDTLFLTVS